MLKCSSNQNYDGNPNTICPAIIRTADLPDA